MILQIQVYVRHHFVQNFVIVSFKHNLKTEIACKYITFNRLIVEVKLPKIELKFSRDTSLRTIDAICSEITKFVPSARTPRSSQAREITRQERTALAMLRQLRNQRVRIVKGTRRASISLACFPLDFLLASLTSCRNIRREKKEECKLTTNQEVHKTFPSTICQTVSSVSELSVALTFLRRHEDLPFSAQVNPKALWKRTPLYSYMTVRVIQRSRFPFNSRPTKGGELHAHITIENGRNLAQGGTYSKYSE